MSEEKLEEYVKEISSCFAGFDSELSCTSDYYDYVREILKRFLAEVEKESC